MARQVSQRRLGKTQPRLRGAGVPQADRRPTGTGTRTGDARITQAPGLHAGTTTSAPTDRGGGAVTNERSADRLTAKANPASRTWTVRPAGFYEESESPL